jgi:hypothetical protein
MLLATVSQAPYCRGGVRQATGESTATLFGDPRATDACDAARVSRETAEAVSCTPSLELFMPLPIFLIHGSQHVLKRDGRKTSGVIGQAIRNDQLAIMDESAARINDIGHIAFPLVLIGLE